MKCLFRVLVLSMIALLSVSANEELSNGHLRLGFNAKGSLVEFSNSEHLFLAPATNGYLWELHWRDTVSGSSGTITSIAPRSFHFERTGLRSARLIWKELGLAAAPDLQIEGVVTLDDAAAMSRWKIVLRNSGTLRFEEVRFPCIQSIAPQENEVLAAPVWIGQIAANPRALLNKDGHSHEARYEYPGHASMQCLALYQGKGPGLYVACDDTNAFHKTFIFSGDGKSAVNFSLLQLPENNSTGTRDYVQPYSAVLGTFSGDWFTAAEIYRGWATNQWWARESRLQKKEKNWAGDTALWVWNRGRSENVIEPALALQKKLGLPVSAMWHWWHGCAYDIGFPEYLPPREGVASFTKALTRGHQQNVHAIVYMNQRLWGMTTKSWKGATNFAVLGADGTIHPEVYNSFTKSPCASMCMGTSFWRDHYAGLTQQAFALGVDGIYMDQACSSLACYNPKHGHPLGGGTYWMNGFRTMSEDIRERAKSVKSNDRIALAGEGVGESWLPYLDLMLSLQVSKDRYAAADGWEPIPFFQAVYHPYVIQYGNYSSLTMPPYDELWPEKFAPKEPLKLLDRKFSQQFYLEQARAFAWGQQPTIANFRESHLKERPEEINYALQLAKIRSRTLNFLQRGTFLRAPDINAPAATIDISRLSIYAGQQGGLTTLQKEMPLALAGAWQSPDGTLGLALASISNEPLLLEFNLDRAVYKLPKRGVIYRVDENKRKKIGRFDGETIKLSVELTPRGACLLEFVSQ
ncbi:MAG: hypothetical protein JWM68_2675 [Verrucomicrobiales bacterium]|nr:hypothetical protein [Verrucomicrobiales bacterium]